MEYGGQPFSDVPFAGNVASSEDFAIFLTLTIVFHAEFVFFGEIGDIIILPPNLALEAGNMNYRRSPCILYEN